MASIPSLDGFMHSIVKKDPKKYIKEYERIIYILAKEFNWSLNDIEETPIPLIFSLIDLRNKDIENQNKEIKKQRMR